jgi:hypothetical protein
MSEPTPIVCTLTPGELQDRGTAWHKLMSSGLVARDRVPGGIRLRAEPGAAAALMELVDLERECCAWIQFDAKGDSVTMTADAAGEAVLSTMFVITTNAGSTIGTE